MIRDVFARLDSLAGSAKKFYREKERLQHLNQLNDLLKAFGSPQESENILHIAGSKGKGSTALFLADTLKNLKYSVLMFTSPHVFDIRERLLFNNEPVDIEIWKETLQNIYDTDVKNLGYFDILTAAAFIIRKKLKADYLILETGLGGRLDATNLCRPHTVLLTPVETEHTQILGTTLAKIAKEKSGIIKPQIPIFCAPQTYEVLKIFQKQAVKKHAPFYYLPEYGRTETTGYIKEENLWLQISRFYCLKNKLHTETVMKMIGGKQADNALLALLCLHNILKISREDLYQAWQKSLKHSSLPGRFEIISMNPLMVLDGCHTPQSLQQSVQAWTAVAGKQGILIFTCQADKNIKGMLPYFKNFSVIILTGNNNHMRKISALTRKEFPHTVYIPCEDEACDYAKKLSGRRPVFAAGSFYFLSIIKSCLLSNLQT